MNTKASAFQPNAKPFNPTASAPPLTQLSTLASNFTYNAMQNKNAPMPSPMISGQARPAPSFQPTPGFNSFNQSPTFYPNQGFNQTGVINMQGSQMSQSFNDDANSSYSNSN